MSTLSTTTVTTANGTTNLTLSTGNTSAGDIVLNATGGIILASNSSVNAVTILANSNIGIGNSSPTHKLRVEGTLSVNGTINDSLGDVRDLPINSQTSAYTLAANDNGKIVSITTGGVTVNGALLIAGEVFSIYNNSGSSQTITQGSGATMYLAGTANTGNRTLAQRGLCTLVCVASNTFVISGAGIS